MDIVDVIVNSYKYINKSKNRHVNTSSSISFWIRINYKFINNQNKNITSKYKKLLNQRDKNIICKCIKFNIFIIPLIFSYDINTINDIISCTLKHENIWMLKILNKYIDLKKFINNYDFVSKLNNINFIKFLHGILSFTSNNFIIKDKFTNYYYSYNNVAIVKYLHKTFRLIKKDFMMCKNIMIRFACYDGNINVIKYFHKVVNMSRKTFIDFFWYCPSSASTNGHLDIVRYLHEHVGLNTKDFTHDNAIPHTCYNGHLNIIKYYCYIMKMDKTVFTENNNIALALARGNKQFHVVDFLQKEYGLIL